MWPTYNFPPLTSSSASSDSLKPKIDINQVAKNISWSVDSRSSKSLNKSTSFT